MVSTIQQLSAAWALPGNRRPRGVVVERINWLEFMAFRRREEAKRRAKQRYEADLPAGCAGCAIGKKWLLQEEVRLRRAFESGASLEQMARDHERTYGAIIARLEKLGYLRTRFIVGHGQVVAVNRKYYPVRPEEFDKGYGKVIFATNRRNKWEARYHDA